MEVMVCLQSSTDSKDNKVVRLGRQGQIIQTIQNDRTGAPLYNNPWYVTSVTTGEDIVKDGGNRIVGVGREGQHVFTWAGEIQGRKLDIHSVSHMTATTTCLLQIYYCIHYNHNRVYVLGKDGSGAMCLLDSTQGIDWPYGIAGDDDWQLWVGCWGGNIHIIEY